MKILKNITLLILFIFSFFLTNKLKVAITNLDSIMIKIKSNYKNYETKAINAKIYQNEIVPGTKAKKVNVSLSYKKMKKIGKYNSNYYVYDYISPKISIENNKDKYIVRGNSKKKMVSINFCITDKRYIKKIVNVLKENNVKATFFVNDNWLAKNIKMANYIKESGFTIGIDKVRSYKYTKILLNKILKQKNIYCKYNKDNIKSCNNLGTYKIKGTIISNNFYKNIKEKLYSGLIITFDDKEVINDLDMIIFYVKSKGFEIVDLDTHLLE